MAKVPIEQHARKDLAGGVLERDGVAIRPTTTILPVIGAGVSVFLAAEHLDYEDAPFSGYKNRMLHENDTRNGCQAATQQNGAEQNGMATPIPSVPRSAVRRRSSSIFGTSLWCVR